MKNKKAQAGTQEVIVWIIVIAVVLIAIIFVTKFDLNTIFKNLPGNDKQEDRDQVIEGIDELIKFDCKYPIGKIEGNKILLINRAELAERNFDSVLEKDAKLVDAFPLVLSSNRKEISIEGGLLKNVWVLRKLTGQYKTIAKLEDMYGLDGKMTSWKKITLEEVSRNFAFGIASTLGNLNYEDSSKIDRDSLALLDGARYSQSLRIICRDEEISTPTDLKYLEELGELEQLLSKICILDREDYSSGLIRYSESIKKNNNGDLIDGEGHIISNAALVTVLAGSPVTSATQNIVSTSGIIDLVEINGVWQIPAKEGILKRFLTFGKRPVPKSFFYVGMYQLMCTSLTAQRAFFDAWDASNEASVSASLADEQAHKLMMSIMTHTKKLKEESEELKKNINKINSNLLIENQKDKFYLLNKSILEFNSNITSLDSEVNNLYKNYNKFKLNDEVQKVGWFRRKFFGERGSEFSDKEDSKLRDLRKPIIDQIVKLRKESERITKEIMELEFKDEIDLEDETSNNQGSIILTS